MSDSRTSKQRFRVERTKCDCHPETCCCPDFTVYDGEQMLVRGNDFYAIRALVNAANEPTDEPQPSASNPLTKLIERVSARIPASVTPSTRIEIHPSEWLLLVDAVTADEPEVEAARISNADLAIENFRLYAQVVTLKVQLSAALERAASLIDAEEVTTLIDTDVGTKRDARESQVRRKLAAEIRASKPECLAAPPAALYTEKDCAAMVAAALAARDARSAEPPDVLRDAERYRWLRDESYRLPVAPGPLYRSLYDHVAAVDLRETLRMTWLKYGDALDKAIDAARSTVTKSEGRSDV